MDLSSFVFQTSNSIRARFRSSTARPRELRAHAGQRSINRERCPDQADPRPECARTTNTVPATWCRQQSFTENFLASL
jgi:hypothetical protein